jgi:hypothetical protein
VFEMERFELKLSAGVFSGGDMSVEIGGRRFMVMEVVSCGRWERSQQLEVARK